MKSFLSLSVIAVLIFVVMVFSFDTNIASNNLKNSEEILRIHVRANSNSEEDQQIKYNAKDLLLEYISDDILCLNSKQKVKEYFETKKEKIEKLLSTFLMENGFDYGASLSICYEYFPLRIYGDTVVESGFYDSIIINLGDGKGENWWCIAYPSLCFSDYKQNCKDVVYKSRLLEIINKIF